MSRNKVKLINSGFKSLMQSAEVVSELEEIANGIIGRCEGNYETNTYIGPTRANVSINTSDEKTFYKNLSDNELIKALRG